MDINKNNKKPSNTTGVKAPQNNKRNSQIGNIIKGSSKKTIENEKNQSSSRFGREKTEKGKAEQKNEAKDKNFEKRGSKTLKDNKNTKGNPPYIKKK